MEYMNSKNIFFLMKDILRLIRPSYINHGVRVSYVVYKMLLSKGGFDEFEIADMILWASLHDVGAYKTESDDNQKRYELRENMPHSIYGYLFFKHLSPRPDISKVFLYHHSDYEKLSGCSELEKELASYINIAERVDIYYNKFGEQFDYKLLFKDLIGSKYSKEGVELFFKAVEEQGLLNGFSGGEYEKELDDFLEEYMIFSNEEKKQYLEMLIYCMGFKDETLVVEAMTCICVAEAIGKQVMLSEVEQEILYYGSLLHDIGMLGIEELPKDADSWTKEDVYKFRSHIAVSESILKERLKPEVYALIVSHHERSDGSGFPKGMRDAQMNKLQKILQVSDEIVSLQRYEKKEQVVASLMAEAEKGRLNRQIIISYLANYEEIQEKVDERVRGVLSTYRKLIAEYELYSKRLKGMK